MKMELNSDRCRSHKQNLLIAAKKKMDDTFNTNSQKELVCEKIVSQSLATFKNIQHDLEVYSKQISSDSVIRLIGKLFILQFYNVFLNFIC